MLTFVSLALSIQSEILARMVGTFPSNVSKNSENSEMQTIQPKIQEIPGEKFDKNMNSRREIFEMPIRNANR